MDGPFRRSFVIGRAGQPRTVNVGQEMHGVHDLRVVRLFLADLFVDVRVNSRLRVQRNLAGESNREENGGEGFGFEHQGSP